MKKLLVSAFTLVMIVAFISPQTIYAGAGEWDKAGSSSFTSKSKIILSGGGSFEACMVGGTGIHEVTLMEEDQTNSDDTIGYALLSPGTCKVWSGLSDEVDGDNGKAEFYLSKSSPEKITVKFRD